MAELRPAKTVDIRGAVCGMSLVKAKSAITSIEDGQVLEVVASGCGAGDIPVWARAAGYKLVAVREGDGLTRLYIQK